IHADLGVDVAKKVVRLLMILGSFAVLVVLSARSFLKPPAFALAAVLFVSGAFISARRNIKPTSSSERIPAPPLLAAAAEAPRAHERIFHYDTVSAADQSPVLGLDQWWKVIPPADDLHQLVGSLWRALFINAGMVEGVGTIAGADEIARESDADLRSVLSIV